MSVMVPPPVLDPALAPIRAKVLAGDRLSFEDGLALYRTRDIFTLGELANLVRERLHGRNAYYNINRHINYTNFCVLRCKFCSFYRPYEKSEEATKRRSDEGEGTQARRHAGTQARRKCGMRNAERGIQSGCRNPVRIPHSAFRIPHWINPQSCRRP